MILNHVTAHIQVEQVLTLVAMWWDLEDIPLRAICQTQTFCIYHSYDYCYSLAWVVKVDYMAKQNKQGWLLRSTLQGS